VQPGGDSRNLGTAANNARKYADDRRFAGHEWYVVVVALQTLRDFEMADPNVLL
jgi:hypothetical protein